jgi:uncharacterized membrane protein YfcA
MTDDKRPGTRWIVWLLVGIGALLGARIVLTAASRVFDLAFTVVVVAAVAVVAWRLAGRDRNRPNAQKEDAPRWQWLKRWWK